MRFDTVVKFRQKHILHGLSAMNQLVLDTMFPNGVY